MHKIATQITTIQTGGGGGGGGYLQYKYQQHLYLPKRGFYLFLNKPTSWPQIWSNISILLEPVKKAPLFT